MLVATVPLVDGNYNMSVPVGEGYLQDINNYNLLRGYQVLFKDQSVTADIGPGARGSIEGTVYNEAGEPIPNVAVCIYSYAGDYGCTTTDGNGQYSFSDLPVGGGYGYYYYGGQYLIYSEGFYSSGSLNVKDETITVDINGLGARVTGVFYSWTGLPVEGVVIQLYDQLLGLSMSATTGVGGVFTFEGVRTGLYYLAGVTGEGAIAIRYWLPVSAAGQEVTVDLIAFPYTLGSCFYYY